MVNLLQRLGAIALWGGLFWFATHLNTPYVLFSLLGVLAWVGWLEAIHLASGKSLNGLHVVFYGVLHSLVFALYVGAIYHHSVTVVSWWPSIMLLLLGAYVVMSYKQTQRLGYFHWLWAVTLVVTVVLQASVYLTYGYAYGYTLSLLFAYTSRHKLRQGLLVVEGLNLLAYVQLGGLVFALVVGEWELASWFGCNLIIAMLMVAYTQTPFSHNYNYYFIIYWGLSLVLLFGVMVAVYLTQPVGLIYGLCVVWAADSFAYMVGKAVGGKKIIPRWSPNKTWSGFVGGVVAGTLVVVYLGFNHYGWLSVVVGLVGAGLVFVGDVLESYYKRLNGVKDSGNVFWGHGGVLDRIDGLLLFNWLALLLLGISYGLQ